MNAKLSALPIGAHFKCGYDDVWIKVRLHGAHADVWQAHRLRDDFETFFCGGAVFKLPSPAEIDRAVARRAPAVRP